MNSGALIEIPLFPLKTVLFPGGPLPLRIFEPRYLDMVSQCLKTEQGIGVILIDGGSEVGKAATTHNVGTLSNISYWHKRDDGMLGVTLFGHQRFKILSSETQPNQLIMASVEMLPVFQQEDISEKDQTLIDLLKQIIAQLEPPFTTMDKHYDDLEWVSARLIELLPFSMSEKQNMLMMDSTRERMEHLYTVLEGMGVH